MRPFSITLSFPNLNSPLKLYSKILFILGLMAVLAVFSAQPAHAEGSGDLFPTNATCATNSANGSCRANFEWRTSGYVNNTITRRTLLRVYAKSGETLLLGSSAVGVTSTLTIGGNILVYNGSDIGGQKGQETIGGTPVLDCNNAQPNKGLISNRTQELAGPVSTQNAAGYTPCSYPITNTGFYAVVMYGPAGATSDANGTPNPDITTINDTATQGTSIDAWDVTVRTDVNDRTTNKPGRLFSYAYALFTGGNGLPVFSTLYALTLDGYIYRTDLNGLDPNGFIIYGNSTGFLDTDGVTPLYHDVVGNNAGLAPMAGGVNPAPPTFPIFVHQPDPDAVAALSIPTTPVTPTINNFSFTGTISGTTSAFNTGGLFNLTTNVAGSFELVISRNGTDFDPDNQQNRVLRGIRNAGSININWDGKDNSGTPFPVGSGYKANFSLRAGEYHFPLIDAENSTKGGPTYTLINSPTNNCSNMPAGCSTGYYNDRSYYTLNRTVVNPATGNLNNNTTPGAVLCGNSPPATNQAIGGFNTTTSQRAFGIDVDAGSNTNTVCDGSFGDTKGLDLWTFFPAQAAEVTLNIINAADIQVRKAVSTTTPRIGDSIVYTITVSNLGPNDATGVQVTDQLPASLSYNSSVASVGTFTPSTGVWVIGNLALNGQVTLTMNVTVNQSGQIINTARKTAENEFDPNGGSDPNGGNNFDNREINVAPPVTTTVPATTAPPAPTPVPTTTAPPSVTTTTPAPGVTTGTPVATPTTPLPTPDPGTTADPVITTDPPTVDNEGPVATPNPTPDSVFPSLPNTGKGLESKSGDLLEPALLLGLCLVGLLGLLILTQARPDKRRK